MRHRVGDIVEIGGISVLATNEREFVTKFDASIEAGQPMKVAFLNANLFNYIKADPSLLKALEEFTVLNDGVGVNIASLILKGAVFPINMNGTDLIPIILSHTKHRLRIFLLGSKPSAVKEACIAIKKNWGRHMIVGSQDGYFSDSEEQVIVQRIRAAKPDLVLVGLGNPKQEIWIARHIPNACPRAFGVGGLFDFLSGDIPRAPAMLRAMSLEWLFRLLYEPCRLWRRYLLGIPVFIARITYDVFVRTSR